MKNVKCSRCPESRLDMMIVETRRKSGYSSICKKCDKKRVELVKRTKNGIVTGIYSAQKHVSKRRKHNPPSYTKEWLKAWLFDNPKFHTLFDNWVKSGYVSDLKPSVDRKDDYIGYTIGNIQLMTWKENLLKAHSDKKNGQNNKINKAVVQFDKRGSMIAEFHSMAEAERITGTKSQYIYRVCKGLRKHANGFIWKEKKDIIKFDGYSFISIVNQSLGLDISAESIREATKQTKIHYKKIKKIIEEETEFNGYLVKRVQICP